QPLDGNAAEIHIRGSERAVDRPAETPGEHRNEDGAGRRHVRPGNAIARAKAQERQRAAGEGQEEAPAARRIAATAGCPHDAGRGGTGYGLARLEAEPGSGWPPQLVAGTEGDRFTGPQVPIAFGDTRSVDGAHVELGGRAGCHSMRFLEEQGPRPAPRA